MVSKASSVVEAYSVLGVEQGSSLDEIKGAYKQLALRTHPDKNPDNPDATAQFQHISAAYNLLLRHLDRTAHFHGGHPQHSPFGFSGFHPNDVDGYDSDYDYISEDDEPEDLAFYFFLYEEVLRQRGNTFVRPRYRYYHRAPAPQRPESPPESPEEAQVRMRRAREEQDAASQRRAMEAKARRVQQEADREKERKETEDRQKSKVKSKKAQAEQSRRDAEDAARALAERGQSIRSATFAAARRGDAERVKRAIWEDAVDANGGELRVGAEAFVKRKPRDPQETLLHISAKQGNAELVKWLDMHSADLEERNSDGFTAFHIALQAGHVPIVEHFLESYPPKDSEHDAIYKAPPSHSLLSLAMSSVQPECVWKVLDNGFATLQDVSAAQIRISSAERLKTSGQKADAVKHEDIRRLLDSFGASTPATAGTERVERPQRHHSTSAAVPSIDDQGQRRDSRKMAPRNGNRRTGQQSPSAPPETPSQKMSNTSAGRGSRGRGRGRGGGRGRGKS